MKTLEYVKIASTDKLNRQSQGGFFFFNILKMFDFKD